MFKFVEKTVETTKKVKSLVEVKFGDIKEGQKFQTSDFDSVKHYIKVSTTTYTNDNNNVYIFNAVQKEDFVLKYFRDFAVVYVEVEKEVKVSEFVYDDFVNVSLYKWFGCIDNTECVFMRVDNDRYINRHGIVLTFNELYVLNNSRKIVLMEIKDA